MYKFNERQSEDQEFYIENTLYRNAQFLLLLRKKKTTPRLYATIKISASVHLSNSLGFVCCISAKVELELNLPNKKKGSQESKYLG